MAKIYSENYTIPFYFSNQKGELTLANLLNIVLQISEKQLIEYKLDSVHMNEKKLGWVVTQYHMDIERMPRVNEEVKIFTTAKSYNKFFCYRDFWIQDSLGNRIVYINSIFVLFDIEQRVMLKVDENLLAPLESEKIKGLEKFPRLKKSSFIDNKNNINISYHNIDSNQHVNNTNYFNWMTDSLNYEFLVEHSIKTVDIKYENELIIGDKPESFMKLEKDDKIISQHRIQLGDKNVSEAIIEWN